LKKKKKRKKKKEKRKKSINHGFNTDFYLLAQVDLIFEIQFKRWGYSLLTDLQQK